ncbi:MAG: LysM peptidoglycan-binding domain-containing protein, partial [Bacteroidota bacterium]
RVDHEIDERLNIVSSTRAAARYIKKNNTFFDNWLYALQAYQMGAGGVMQHIKDDQHGASRMEITSKTYWYVKKFLAYKIAYQDHVSGPGQIQVQPFENRSHKSLADLAKEITMDETELRNYNKWAKSGIIPDDRPYVVVIPVTGGREIAPTTAVASYTVKAEAQKKADPKIAPKLLGDKRKVNGVVVIQALVGENSVRLAERAQVDLSAFLKWNDLSISDPLQAGSYYYVARKRVRAAEAFHKLKAGENLWSVSQQYGVQLKKLKKYNRLHDEEPAVGTMLWLSSMRPKDADKIAVTIEAVQVDNAQAFHWAVTPEEKLTPEVKETTSETAKPDTASIVVVEQEEAAPDSTLTRVQPAATEQQVTVVDTTQRISIQVPMPARETHTVVPGETLYAIAKIYNLAVMDLVKWNNLDLQQGIKPGLILKLFDHQPVANGVETTKREIFHEVKPSDTLYSVARQYGVTIKELMEWNGKKDFSLAIGEKLKVLQK